MEPLARLGIIGGSGLYGLDGLDDAETIDLDTPFGRPSSVILTGSLHGVPVAFLSRHGDGHTLSPSEVPYAANVCALKMAGVTRLVSISAVGSLQEELAPGGFVIPDNIIDRTVSRNRSFFGDGVVAHVSLGAPFCSDLTRDVLSAAGSGGLSVATGGTYVCIEGPQFSTKAESHLFRSWGASIIGMTAMPEARFAREAELCYACLAMVTDYDVWHESEATVTLQGVLENLAAMTGAVQKIVPALAEMVGTSCTDGCSDALRDAIVTDVARIPDEVRERLDPIAGRYLNQRSPTT